MIRFHKLAIFFTNNLRLLASQSTSKLIFKDIAQSSYFKPIQKVQDFFNEQHIKYEQATASLRIRECPFCTQPHYGNLLNMYTLNVDKEDGKFLCSRCSKKGSWDELKAKILNIGDVNKSKTLLEESANSQQISELEYNVLTQNLQLPEYESATNYLKLRGFNEQTIKKYKVGAGNETFISEMGKQILVKVLYFPMFEAVPKSKSKQATGGELLDVKMSKVKVRGASAEDKKYTRQFPSGSKSGLFGLNTIKKTDKTLVITEGEFDAMSVHQVTGLPTVSLPQGANSLPDRLLPCLNNFEKIILWMDNDEAGKLGAQKISHKLGQKRTYIIKHNIKTLKDANDFLRSCPEKIHEVIQQSKTKPGESIHKYIDYTDLVKQRIFNQDQFLGVQVDCIPYFNKKVKGIRMEEVTIVSGPTGCGKTTLLSQLSLDLCKKGISVLWGSFQIRNDVLVTNMMNQFAGINLFRKKDLFDHYANQFTNLPMHWLNFHGSNDIDKVLATIQYSIQKHNVSFVVLDTLQFMLSDQAEGIKKFDLQDKVMTRLRKMASRHKVHIVIVIHPRKTQESQDVQIHSIYGTSKAAQEADNIWIVQNRESFRVLDIKKNRFDGDVGKVALGYDKETRKFLQLTRSQLLALMNKDLTVQQIVEARTESGGPSEDKEEESFRLQPETQSNQIEEDLIARKRPKFHKGE